MSLLIGFGWWGSTLLGPEGTSTPVGWLILVDVVGWLSCHGRLVVMLGLSVAAGVSVL
ncbi:MAG: hypothetical protein M3315_08730 [Actinomycetota bacterium]|jgi:hypothetical protein|nr:hypothetical protein [Actinomycetota bacterium]